MSLRALARDLAPVPVRRWWRMRALDGELRATGEAELDVLPALVRAGDLALDVGANVGLFALALARLGARVIAFEPNPSMVNAVRLLRLRGVEVRPYALSDRDGGATLALPDGDTGRATIDDARVPQGDPRMAVALRRLDDLGLTGVTFIKIDVEGHEEAVLDGGAATIARDRPALLIEIEEAFNPGGLVRIAARLDGHRGWFLIDRRWHPLDDFDVAVHQDSAALDPMRRGEGRRVCRYYNNFLFLPEGRTPPEIHAKS